MTVQILFSVVAIFLPWFSVRAAWFLIWAVTAAATVLIGMIICMDGAQGWEGLGCLIIAFMAAILVLASIAVGIVRVVNTGGGKRPGNIRTTLVAAAVSYGLAVLLLLLFITMGR